MKYKSVFIAGLAISFLSHGNIVGAEQKTESTQSQEKISAEAAKEHILAAEQLEEAAGHHRKVAQYYKAGKFEDAGWNAYMAYAHSLRAQEHINAAAMLHLSEKRNLTDKTAPTEPKL